GAAAMAGMCAPTSVIEAWGGPDGARREPERGPEFAPRRVVSEKTARTLRDMLQEVTIDGTGQKAQVVGYTTGGKTGTAQKIDPATHRYTRGHYAAWFGGFVPAAHPALVIVVMVDEPKGPHTHGGDVSAPVFSHVAEPVLRYLGILPDREDPVVIDPSLHAETRLEAPAVRPASLRISSAAPAGAAAARAGGGAPASTAAVVRSSLFSLPVAVTPATEAETGVMPDLTGMS